MAHVERFETDDASLKNKWVQPACCTLHVATLVTEPTPFICDGSNQTSVN
jgi:hypothetical protein